MKPGTPTDAALLSRLPPERWREGLRLPLDRVGERGWSDRAFRALAVTAVLAALSGCVAPEPWVKPYEREKLADPVMAFSSNPLMDRYRQHVFDVREAARGAGASEGGGCGCN